MLIRKEINIPCLECLLLDREAKYMGCGGCLGWTMDLWCPNCGLVDEVQNFSWGKQGIKCPKCHYHPTQAEWELQITKASWQSKRDAVLSKGLLMGKDRDET